MYDKSIEEDLCLAYFKVTNEFGLIRDTYLYKKAFADN